MLVMLTGLLLIGCASVQLVKSDAAKLMPDAVARQVLTKYFGAEWVQRPYLTPKWLLFCKNKNFDVKFPEIKTVTYLPLGNQVTVGNDIIQRGYGCGLGYMSSVVSVSSDSETQQITEAFIALGVPIRGYIKQY